jgi:hypothetical protein
MANNKNSEERLEVVLDYLACPPTGLLTALAQTPIVPTSA